MPVQSEPFQPRRCFVGGRPATLVGEWDEHPDFGYYYRHDGEKQTHWIRCGNPFLTAELPKANFPVPSLLFKC